MTCSDDIDFWHLPVAFHFYVRILYFFEQHKHKKKRKESSEGNEDELIVDVHNEDGKVFHFDPDRISAG